MVNFGYEFLIITKARNYKAIERPWGKLIKQYNTFFKCFYYSTNKQAKAYELYDNKYLHNYKFYTNLNFTAQKTNILYCTLTTDIFYYNIAM